MDFLNDQKLIKVSKKYSQIYILFKEKYSIKYHDLFVIAAAVGFINNNEKEPIDKKNGIEFRTNYFNSTQKSSMYSIILNDQKMGKQIEKFEEKHYILKYCLLLERYAEGGMEIIVNKIFKNKWDNNNLDENYSDYDIDLFRYVLSINNDIPF